VDRAEQRGKQWGREPVRSPEARTLFPARCRACDVSGGRPRAVRPRAGRWRRSAGGSSSAGAARAPAGGSLECGRARACSGNRSGRGCRCARRARTRRYAPTASRWSGRTSSRHRCASAIRRRSSTPPDGVLQPARLVQTPGRMANSAAHARAREGTHPLGREGGSGPGAGEAMSYRGRNRELGPAVDPRRPSRSRSA
jgi:hypothetical protein